MLSLLNTIEQKLSPCIYIYLTPHLDLLFHCLSPLAIARLLANTQYQCKPCHCEGSCLLGLWMKWVWPADACFLPDPNQILDSSISGFDLDHHCTYKQFFWWHLQQGIHCEKCLVSVLMTKGSSVWWDGPSIQKLFVKAQGKVFLNILRKLWHRC